MADEWNKISDTLSNPDYKWRTIDGIVKESGLDRSTVEKCISDNEELIIKSSIPSTEGKELYATREHYRQKSSVWQVISSAITNKVG